METDTVTQLDGADKDGKRDKKETSAGVKRGRGTTSGAPSTKAMQLSSGERVATGSGGEKEEEEEEGGEEVEGGEESEGSKKEKSSGKQKHEQPSQKFSTHRPRTRSLSNSDSPLAPGVTTPTKTSPMTRSHSAVKKDVEFVSLPSTKKRKKGGGRWPRRETPSPSPSQETSKTETPVKGSKSDAPNKSADTKKGAQESATEEGEGEQEEEDAPPPQPVAPPKRRRGRPPKKKDPTTPISSSSSSSKGKGTSGGGSGSGGGRGRGKGRAHSGDSAETERKGKSKTEGGSSSKDKQHSSEGRVADSGGSGKMSKSAAAKEKDGGENMETETPLPASGRSEGDSASSSSTPTPTEKKKKKKERRASGEDRKLNEGKAGRGEKVSRKASIASLEEETLEKKGESPVGREESSSGVAEKAEEDARGGGKRGGGTRGSVFVSVLSGPSGEAMGTEADPKAKEKEEEVEVVSHDPAQQSHDLRTTADEAVQKAPLMVQSTCSPTLPYPATTIPPFPHHAAYPYPGPYPPPLMFPGPSNPMYPHYYPGYPPLPPPPPPPPPVASSQPMPGSFIPPCPTEPLTSPFSVTTTAVGGVQVSVFDKPPTQLPTALSPHSPHPISSQPQPPSTHTVGEPASLSDSSLCLLTLATTVEQ